MGRDVNQHAQPARTTSNQQPATMSAPTSRRAYLRQELAAALALIDGVTLIEGAMPEEAASGTGAWRTGSVHFDPLHAANAQATNAPPARPNKEVGAMIALLRVRVTVTRGGDIDDAIGVLEDAIDAGLQSYRPSAPWQDARRRVQCRSILRADIAPAVVREDDAPTGEVIVPLSINFTQEWLS